MYIKQMAAIALVISMFTGCATVTGQNNSNITFNSTPEGAKVLINGSNVGTTPTTVNVKYSLSAPDVQIKLKGYDTQNVVLQNNFNTISILNVFFWPGFLIDAATGSLMKYSQTSVNADLTKTN